VKSGRMGQGENIDVSAADQSTLHLSLPRHLLSESSLSTCSLSARCAWQEARSTPRPVAAR
jgi:hypothetical protein